MRKIKSIWFLLETILKIPALFLIFCYFGVLIFFRDEKASFLLNRFMNNQLPPIDRKEFFDKINSAATHISFILYLTILAYFILS